MRETGSDRAVSKEGLFAHAASWLSTLIAHFRVRLQLVGLESKEAAVHFGIIAGLVAGGLVLLIFGYFFFCLTMVFLIAWAFGDGDAWIWVLFAMAVLHFAAAGGLVFWAKVRLGEPMFAATLGELRKDQQWLISAKERPR